MTLRIKINNIDKVPVWAIPEVELFLSCENNNFIEVNLNRLTMQQKIAIYNGIARGILIGENIEELVDLLFPKPVVEVKPIEDIPLVEEIKKPEETLVATEQEISKLIEEKLEIIPADEPMTLPKMFTEVPSFDMPFVLPVVNTSPPMPLDLLPELPKEEPVKISAASNINILEKFQQHALAEVKKLEGFREILSGAVVTIKKTLINCKYEDLRMFLKLEQQGKKRKGLILFINDLIRTKEKQVLDSISKEDPKAPSAEEFQKRSLFRGKQVGLLGNIGDVLESDIEEIVIKVGDEVKE